MTTSDFGTVLPDGTSIVIHWSRLSMGPLLALLLAAERCAFLPLLAGDGAVSGVAVALPGGAIHIVDFALVPGSRGELMEAIGSCAVMLDQGDDLRFMPVPPAQMMAVNLTARVLDGGCRQESDFTLRRLAGDRLNIDLPILDIPQGQHPLSGRALTMAAHHIQSLQRLDAQLLVQARAQGLQSTVELEQQVAPAIQAMAQKGVLVDPSWDALVSQYNAKEIALAEELRGELGVRAMNDAELLQALQQQGLDVRGTSRESLAPFMSHPSVPKIIEWHRRVAFVRDLGRSVSEARRSSIDGRVRAAWNQMGCATGRMTTTSPNLLGIPRDPEVRRCFIPAPGHVFVVADYSTIELRVIAEITGDQTLIDVFCQGGDPHRITAASLKGKPKDEVTDTERRAAKAVNFGFAYAMGINTFRGHALTEYNVSLTEQEAREAKNAFYATYPGIEAWHQTVKREMPRETRTLEGRVRYFPDGKSYNARLASPVQGTVADALKRSILLAAPELKFMGAGIVLAVHDELVVEVLEAQAPEAKQLVVEAMKFALEQRVSKVPIEVKASIRKSWAEEDAS